MTAARKLEIANAWDAVGEKLMTPLCIMSVGLIPMLFLGCWCMLSCNVFLEAIGWLCATYMLAACLLFFSYLVISGVASHFRNRWWRETEDPWRVWQIDHYGKVVD